MASEKTDAAGPEQEHSEEPHTPLTKGVQLTEARLIASATDETYDFTYPRMSSQDEEDDWTEEETKDLDDEGELEETVIGSLASLAFPEDLMAVTQPNIAVDEPEPTTSTIELVATEEPWRQLHAASLYINIIPQTYRTLRGLWPLLLLLLFGGQGNGTAGLDLSMLLVFFAISISRTVVHFLTLRYRLNAGKLEIRSGLLNRRSRVLDPYRIQNMELAQNPLHKLAGLVELRVETAGDTSTDGLLSALKVDEAERLKRALERLARSRRRQQGLLTEEAEEEAATQPLLSISAVELIAFGLSKRRVGTVALLFAAGLEVITYLDPYQTQQVASELSTNRLIGAVLLAFSVTWIFSAGQALLRHFGFRLGLRGDRLVSTEGLLTRRSVEIPQGKVQLVRIDEPWLRRQMGYGTMLVETAALGMADGEVRQAEGVIPMVPSEQLAALTAQAAPAIAVDPWSVPLRPAHPRALYRLLIGNLVRASMLSAFLIAVLPFPWSLGALVLLPLSLPLSWLDWRNQGWLVTPHVILSRRGYLTRRTWVIARSKVQSVHMGQTPLMRWHTIAGINIAVAGSHVRLPDIGLGDGRAVLAELRETWLPNRAVAQSSPL